jgi:pimeloyl-ACP methyl ester carboxylesterase
MIARMAMALLALCFSAMAARAQVPERSIAEIKVETQARAERGAYPLGGLQPDDVRAALALISTRDRDDWAQGWSTTAARYRDAALAATTDAARDAAWLRAWRLFYFAQWPVPASPGKQRAYADALDAYLQHAALQHPRLEVVQIPFEGSQIIAYLRLPDVAGKVPVVLAISGLDSRKETVAETYAALLPHGIGFIAVDSPGTGQAPLKVGPHAERMFSKVIDYLLTRPEVDPKRIAAHGVSFGGYWAAKLAILERDRLAGVVVQSPPIDGFFSETFLRENTLGNREYLFDLAPAFTAVVEGAATTDDLARLLPPLSLAQEGLLTRPTTKMLVVGGVKDTQVPISDLELLLRSGDVPKEAWINPKGGHLGREATGWTDPVIFARVILPWELRLLQPAAD